MLGPVVATTADRQAHSRGGRAQQYIGNSNARVRSPGFDMQTNKRPSERSSEALVGARVPPNTAGGRYPGQVDEIEEDFGLPRRLERRWVPAANLLVEVRTMSLIIITEIMGSPGYGGVEGLDCWAE